MDDIKVNRALSRLEEGMRELKQAELKQAELKQARRRRRPSLGRAIKQARKQGVTVSGATIALDGSVSLTFGEPQHTEASNPWLDEIERMKKQ